MSLKYLIQGATGAGAGNAFTPGKDGNTESFTIAAFGTFGTGGSVKVEVTHDGVNWFDSGIVFTAAGAQNLFGKFAGIRGNITAGSGFTLNLTIL